MHHRLGLSRDPFAASDDPALYWESRPRAALRKSALDALRRGQGVWITGPSGAGRQALVRAVCRAAGEEGLPLVLLDEPVPPSSSLLAALYPRLRPGPTPADPLDLAEGVYAALLDGCWRGGPVVALGVPDAARAAGDELALLHALRFLGRAVAPLLLTGGGEAPLPGLLRLEAAPFSREELLSLVRHRCLACGNSAALDADPWATALDTGVGVGDALALASQALARLAFHAARPEPEPPPEVPEASPLFPSEALAEVGQLLRSLSNKTV